MTTTISCFCLFSLLGEALSEIKHGQLHHQHCHWNINPIAPTNSFFSTKMARFAFSGKNIQILIKASSNHYLLDGSRYVAKPYMTSELEDLYPCFTILLLSFESPRLRLLAANQSIRFIGKSKHNNALHVVMVLFSFVLFFLFFFYLFLLLLFFYGIVRISIVCYACMCTCIMHALIQW